MTRSDLRADAERYGIDVFTFSIVARFNNAQAMLRREQLLIAMYYNAGCYNYAASVYSHGALGIVRVHVLGEGAPYVQEFLSLHAAVRAFGLSKRVVREAITAGHGRVGAIQFPINVPMTRVIDGDFPHPFQETGQQFKIAPRALPAKRRSAAQAQAAWPAEVAQALNLQARSVAAWRDGQSRQHDSKSVLLRLVELLGVEWASAAAPFVGAEGDLPEFLAKYNLIDHAIVEWMAMTQARWTKLMAGTQSLTRIERILLGLAAHYGYLEGRPIGDTGPRYRATLLVGPGERL